MNFMIENPRPKVRPVFWFLVGFLIAQVILQLVRLKGQL